MTASGENGCDIAVSSYVEQRDTREAMDKVWEEEMVTFGAGDAQSACKTPPSGNGVSAAAGDQFVPVTWVDFKTSGPARAS